MTDSGSNSGSAEWIFGYGSLMWNPGFPFVEKQPALLTGYHRSFCIYSHHHRGTADRPGLVLGLDQGGECNGMAYRIDPKDEAEVIAYLDERELIGYAYKARDVALTLQEGKDVMAHTYVADRTHPHFAGQLSPTDSAHLISKAEGVSGSNHTYAANLVKMLETQGFPDEHLLEVLHCVGVYDLKRPGAA